MKAENPKPQFDPERLKNLQSDLSNRIVLKDKFSGPKKIGGVDQSFSDSHIYSGFVVLGEDLHVIEKKCARSEIEFPYIPGLLAFREIPPVLKVWKRIENKPDVLLVDGHGVVHPRGLGLAAHVGLVLDVPTIGVAKNPLVGSFREPEKPGGSEDIRFEGEVVGKVFKSKEGCNPIFISPGNRISVNTSLDITKRCLKGHKLPEPTHRAHKWANKCKRMLDET